MNMQTVGVRELKQNASKVLAQVEDGESFLVTVQGREVAQLIPSPAIRATWVPAERMMAVYDVPVDSDFWADIDRARSDSVQEDPWDRSQ